MKKGFTIIELLVAVSIMAVISTIGLTSYQTVQSKARDTVRKQDLNTLATALEVYFQKNGYYIPGNGDCNDSQILYNSNIGLSSYIAGDIPNDPATKQRYCYISIQNGESYRLFAKLENCQTDADSLYKNDPNQASKCTTAKYDYTRVSADLALVSAPADPATLLTVALPGAPSPSPAGGNVGIGTPSPPSQPGQAPAACTITSSKWGVPSTSTTYSAGLEIKGDLRDLSPNKSYQVLACLQDGECSSGGNLSIRTDGSGATSFSGLNINVPHESGNPVTKVSVVEVVPEPSPLPSPPPPPPPTSLQANYSLAAGPITVTLSPPSSSPTPSGGGSLTITQTPVVTLGQSVSLKVETQGNCAGKKINFEIREDDGPTSSQPITANPAPADIIGNLAQSFWAAEYQCDGGISCPDDPPEYFFNSNIQGEPNVVRSANPKLQVTEPEPIPIPRPGVSTLTASEISSNLAKLNAQINPRGLPTQASFRWGSTETSDCSTLPFDSNTLNPDFSAANALVAFSATIGQHSNGTLRLLPAADYWFCAQAESSAGGTYGNVVSFRTRGIPPTMTVFNPPDHVSNITPHSAKVKAKINPQNQVTKVWYKYGPNETACDLLPNKIPNDDIGREIGGGINDIADEQQLSNLFPHTTYYFCAQATNPTPPIQSGAVQSFTTLSLAPTIREADTIVTDITANSAKLNTKINPNNQTTAYQFRYGTNNTTDCNNLTNLVPDPAGNITAGVADVPKDQTISLFPAQTYRFCVKAINATGTTISNVQNFDTLRIPPTITNDNASDITHNSAKLNAFINPNNLPTNYLFRYGINQTIVCSDLPDTIPATAQAITAGVAGVPKQQSLTGLTPGVTYRFCAYASNDDSNPATLGDGPNLTNPQAFTTFNYTLAASGNITIDQTDAGGQTNTITATRTPTTASPGNITLSASGLPSGATITFTPANCNPTCDTTTKVITANTLSNSYPITITSSPIAQRSTSFTLFVRDNTRPTQPTNLAATPASHSQINLSWTASTDNIGVTGYDIYLGAVFLGNVVGSVTSFSHTSLIANTPYNGYVVKAKDAAGHVSDDSTPANVSATTLTRPPSEFEATPVNASRIDLAWNAPAGAIKYKIYRDNSLIHTLENATCTSCGYSDTGRLANTNYNYKVTAINYVNGESLPSAASALTHPSAPTGLNASAASASQINLFWIASVGGATDYKIFRCSNPTNDCTPTTPALATVTSVSHQDTDGLSGNTTYRYTVRAANQTGTSAATAIASATTLCADNTTPGTHYQDDDADGYGDAGFTPIINSCAPSDGHRYVPSVVNNNDCNDDVANIFQTKNVSEDQDHDGYSIGTRQNQCVGTSLDPPHTSARVYYKAAGGSHTWWEGASTAADCDDNLSTVGPCPPSTPQNLRAITVSSSHIRLKWTASTGATSYHIWNCQGSSCSFTASANTTSLSADFFNDTNLICGTTYRYKIRAVSDAGIESGDSNIVEATTYACGDNNLLANAGFESGTLDEWGCGGNGSGSCEIGSITGRSGNYAVKVHDTAGSTFGWQIAQGGITHSASQDETFCLSARVRKAYNDGGATVSIAIQEAADPWYAEIIGTADNGNSGTPNGVWQSVKRTLTVPSSFIPTLQVYARVWFPGQEAWFDDIKLTSGVCITPPAAPGTPTATAGNGQATVSWTAPSSNGGSAITSYTVTSNPGNHTATCSSSTCLASRSISVTGLTNGTSYTFTVTATNAAGTGPASAASTAVTPATLTAPDLTVTSDLDNGTITLGWQPASTGATGYDVIYCGDSADCAGTGAQTLTLCTGSTNPSCFINRSYTDRPVCSHFGDRTRYYFVRAHGPGGVTADSNIAQGTRSRCESEVE